MTDATTWVKFRPDKHLSWYVARGLSAVDVTWSRCGLWFALGAPRSKDLPLGEKSCETCLRLVKRKCEVFI